MLTNVSIRCQRSKCTNIAPHYRYLIDMTDIDFDNFLDLDYRPLSYHAEETHQAFGQWPGAAFLEPHANCSDDLEHIYTGLHKSVDQVVAQIAVRSTLRLDRIQEQNRRLIDKLTTLESAITGNAAAAIGSESPDVEPVRSASKRRRVSQPSGTGSETTNASIPNTPNVSPFPSQKCVHTT